MPRFIEISEINKERSQHEEQVLTDVQRTDHPETQCLSPAIVGGRGVKNSHAYAGD